MKIIIGEGSCGIAAGAAKIHDYLGEHAQFAELSITGCIGMCYLEPIVDVIEDGIKRTYCKVSTELLPEFTAALERRDFEGAFLNTIYAATFQAHCKTISSHSSCHAYFLKTS